jgi:hypothetical protein
MEAINSLDCAATKSVMIVSSGALVAGCRYVRVIGGSVKRQKKGCVRLSGLAAPPERKSRCLNHFPNTRRCRQHVGSQLPRCTASRLRLHNMWVGKWYNYSSQHVWSHVLTALTVGQMQNAARHVSRTADRKTVCFLFVCLLRGIHN